MNSHLTELVKAANRNRAFLKNSRPAAGYHYIYCLHSKKLNMSYVGKTKQAMYKRMNMHRNPPNRCSSTQLFALGDPEWRILEIVETESAGEREEWHIAHTRAATNVNERSVPLAGSALRRRQQMQKWKAVHRCPEKNRQTARAYSRSKNAEAVALGYKSHYHRLKAERIAAGFII
jgi:hypothetical protein